MTYGGGFLSGHQVPKGESGVTNNSESIHDTGFYFTVIEWSFGQ